MLNVNLLHRYQQIQWERLLRSDLGNTGQLTDAKPVFDRIKSIFDRIIASSITATLSQQAKSEIEAELNNFLDFIDYNVLNFSDVAQRPQRIEEIKNIEWRIVGVLGKVLPYYPPTEEQKIDIAEVVNQAVAPLKKEWDTERSQLESFRLALPVYEKDLEKGLIVARQLVDNSGVIETAIARADDLVKKNEQAVQLILQSNATDASQKAKEHATYIVDFVDIWMFRKIPLLKKIRQPSWRGSFGWLIGSFISGLSVLGIVAFFVFEGSSDLTIGTAILRISAILAPAYFTVFCSQQYLNHRRLYEAYRFKDVALQTMLNLRGRLPNNSKEQAQVLEKSLNVLFAEPSLKEDIKYDKQLLTEILHLLKR